MALTTIQGQIVDAGLQPTSGIVHVALVTSTDGSRPPGVVTGGILIIDDVEPAVAVNGTWSATVADNDSILPDGTWYQIISQATKLPYASVQLPPTVLNVIVPAAGGPFDVNEILAAPPDSLAGPHSHSAAQVPFTPTGTIAATTVQTAIAEVALEAAESGSFTWASPFPLAVWGPITHDLGFRPQFLVVDTAGDLWWPTPTLYTPTQITLDFGGIAVNGTVYLS